MNGYNDEALPLDLSSNQFINFSTFCILTSYSFVAPFTKDILNIALFLFSSTFLATLTLQVVVRSEPSNEKIDKDFYSEPSNYQYMNFDPMMYYPQSIPTYIEYDNNYNNEELDGYRLARARRLPSSFFPSIWPWWIGMNR
ncbi:hypothetical protein GJ703_03482 [Clostridium botulinum]|nr:hypothetical protein RSJ9_2933 [Clostridium botulinum]APQ96268.1 hypothetical protein RSJ3_1389 [Clostridium botulinum]QGT45201.1 hypothetical protein GJ703_03482 [Clostridium botulinum]RUT54728.1 hypothetical protein NPD9_980 [Clostridium botulinum]BAQ36427.1 hypothetical protein CBB2_3424 [Clostridium botulinum]